MATIDITQMSREELEEALMKTNGDLHTAVQCLAITKGKVEDLENQLAILGDKLIRARSTATLLASILKVGELHVTGSN